MAIPAETVDLLPYTDHAPAVTGVKRFHESPQSAWSVVTVAPGERWEAPAADAEERSFVVLGGVATFTVDAWRESLSSGHTLHAEPGATVAIRNEGEEPLTALLATTPPTESFQ